MKIKNNSLFVKWIGIYFFSLVVGAINIGAFGSLLKLIAIVPIFIWILEKHSFYINKELITFCLFFCCCMFSYIWSIDRNITLSRIISQLTFLILIIAVSGYKYTDDELLYLKKSLVWSSRITALVVLMTGNYLEGRIYLSGIINEDPNYLCAYFLFGIVFAITTILSDSNIRKKIFYFIELGIYIYIAIGTGSRGGVLAILASSILAFFLYKSKNKYSFNDIYKKAIFIIILILGIVWISNYIDLDILNRFSEKTLSSSNGTGRFDLWNNAIDAFKNSNIYRTILGYGTGSAIAITYIFPFKRHNVFHNMFVEVLLELGILGECVYLLHISSFFQSSVKQKNYFCISIMIGMIILSLSTSIYAFKPYWNIMLFILCNSLKKKEVIDNENKCYSSSI